MESTNLPEERRASIVEILNEEGKVTAPDLSRRLDVSVDTIRRDLICLENAGRLTKVHGGALPCSPATAPYNTRKNQNSSAKVQIAKRTAQLIQPRQIVFMDSGTTVEEIAHQLPLDLEATVVTASIPVASALGGHTNIKVIMPGGILDAESMTLAGNGAMESLRRIRADLCVLGVCSIDPKAGITCTRFEETDMKCLLIQNAKEVVVPVTTDKLGTAAAFVIDAVDLIDVLVVENSTPDEQLEPYRELGIRIERGE